MGDLIVSCRLDECPPGLFICNGCLGFKSEYRTEKGICEAYVVASGEFFWGGAQSNEAREALMVTPVVLTDASALRLSAIDPEQGH